MIFEIAMMILYIFLLAGAGAWLLFSIAKPADISARFVRAQHRARTRKAFANALKRALTPQGKNTVSHHLGQSHGCRTFLTASRAPSSARARESSLQVGWVPPWGEELAFYRGDRGEALFETD